jgi:predicted metal-dependent enzyme (double-stranded beta helix superfamily)
MTEDAGTGALPSPLSHFMAQLDELRAGGVPDMGGIGRLLTELAADDEFFTPLIAGMPPAAMGVHWLVKPERGPRLVLVHRPEGVMAYTHSHGCWVAIAPVRGAETHQRWNVLSCDSGRAELSLADERVLHRGDVATLIPPRDVHNHGHVRGTGPARTRSSSWATTCSSSSGRNTILTRERGRRLRLAIRAGTIAHHRFTRTEIPPRETTAER